MMKISEIENCIPMALALFKRKFPHVEIPEITVLEASKITKERAQIYKECGESGLVETENLYGEFIDGKLGNRIIIYQNMLDSQMDVFKALWHELGHVLFGSKKEHGIGRDAISADHRGHSLYSEFIAEYTVYVLGGHMECQEKNPNEYLCMTFPNDDTVIPYWLSRYMSSVLGDPYATEKFVSQSYLYVPHKDVWVIIHSMLELLKGQLKKEEYWKPSPDNIASLGYLYSDIIAKLASINRKTISTRLPE